MDGEIRSSDHEEAGYEPPAIEEVVSAEDLERESLYAGVIGSPAPN